MIQLTLALILWSVAPAIAAPVAVTSGEHDGFTRLVFEYGKPVDWTLGRTLDGYELRLNAETATYDFRQAFDLIGKSRLAAIWADPKTGAVHVGLACACHAIPFEFRPGIVVIDLKDGAPPKGSSFELAADGQTIKPIEGRATNRPKARPATFARSDPAFDYDWTLDARTNPPKSLAFVKSAPAEDILIADPGLQPLRDTLLHQMARGAAQGLIEIAEPSAKSGNLSETAFPSAQIRIGDQASNLDRPDTSVKSDLTSQGDICVEDDALSIGGWGDSMTPLSQQIAGALAGLTGEFDRPDPEAIERAIQFYLFLGFGAEARQFISAFAPESPNVELWRSLSYLLDEDADPNDFFVAQAACGGAAALWGVLASPDLVKGDAVNPQAIKLAFSALPLHLRRQLGPILANRFIALGDPGTARDLTTAILRAPGNAGDKVALVESSLELHDGAPQKAEDRINRILDDPGPDRVDALVSFINARVGQRLPIEADLALELQALLAEHKGSEDEQKIGRAVVLARAASGDFAGAFEDLNDFPDLAQDVWALTAQLSPDLDLLQFAVLSKETDKPRVDRESATLIAKRLADLGLAGPAERWLQGLDDLDPLLRARLALGQRDGQKALAALANQSTTDAANLRSLALDMIDQEEPRAALLETMGQADLASVAWARARAWETLSKQGTGLWRDLARRLDETPASKPEGSDLSLAALKPLARAQQLASAGIETRTTIDALLQTLPSPLTKAP